MSHLGFNKCYTDCMIWNCFVVSYHSVTWTVFRKCKYFESLSSSYNSKATVYSRRDAKKSRKSLSQILSQNIPHLDVQIQRHIKEYSHLPPTHCQQCETFCAIWWQSLSDQELCPEARWALLVSRLPSRKYAACSNLSAWAKKSPIPAEMITEGCDWNELSSTFSSHVRPESPWLRPSDRRTVVVESSSSFTRAPWMTKKLLKLNQANNWRRD